MHRVRAAAAAEARARSRAICRMRGCMAYMASLTVVARRCSGRRISQVAPPAAPSAPIRARAAVGPTPPFLQSSGRRWWRTLPVARWADARRVGLRLDASAGGFSCPGRCSRTLARSGHCRCGGGAGLSQASPLAAAAGCTETTTCAAPSIGAAAASTGSSVDRSPCGRRRQVLRAGRTPSSGPRDDAREGPAAAEWSCPSGASGAHRLGALSEPTAPSLAAVARSRLLPPRLAPRGPHRSARLARLRRARVGAPPPARRWRIRRIRRAAPATALAGGWLTIAPMLPTRRARRGAHRPVARARCPARGRRRAESSVDRERRGEDVRRRRRRRRRRATRRGEARRRLGARASRRAAASIAASSAAVLRVAVGRTDVRLRRSPHVAAVERPRGAGSAARAGRRRPCGTRPW